jgi:hypothetical protein
MMESRISRTELIVGNEYYKNKMVKGTLIKEYVGKYIRTYWMGSGDGMTVHLEFEKDGVKVTVDDEMWGSVSGHELAYFTLVV